MRCFSLSLIFLLVLTASAAHGQTSKSPQDVSDEAFLKVWEALKPGDIPSLIQKAEAGDVMSELVLAFAYCLGEGGLKKDYTEAARWFRKGIDRDLGLAQCGLGMIALTATEDYGEAKNRLSKAAGQGKQCGEFFLGTMYHDGKGVAKDLATAAGWYRKAGERTGPWTQLAQNFLGEIAEAYETGKGANRTKRRPQNGIECWPSGEFQNRNTGSASCTTRASVYRKTKQFLGRGSKKLLIKDSQKPRLS